MEICRTIETLTKHEAHSQELKFQTITDRHVEKLLKAFAELEDAKKPALPVESYEVDEEFFNMGYVEYSD